MSWSPPGAERGARAPESSKAPDCHWSTGYRWSQSLIALAVFRAGAIYALPLRICAALSAQGRNPLRSRRRPRPGRRVSPRSAVRHPMCPARPQSDAEASSPGPERIKPCPSRSAEPSPTAPRRDTPNRSRGIGLAQTSDSKPPAPGIDFRRTETLAWSLHLDRDPPCRIGHTGRALPRALIRRHGR
jgi:hypothetical protein